MGPDELRLGVLVALTVVVGWAAGLFWTFTIAVMPGLAAVDDRSFVASMQQMNRAILNPWLGLALGGSLVLLVVALVLHLPTGHRSALVPLGVALVLFVAVLVVTGVVNVPLNDALEAAGDPARIGDLAAVRSRFEDRWVPWNTVRTVLSTGSLAAVGWALVVAGRAGG